MRDTTMQVTAAVARAPGQDFTLETVELDEPRADEILVRVAAVGDLDEANAVIGLARRDAGAALDEMLGRIQNDLFDLGGVA